MATLETLRTKAGVFVSIIIGIALLAFIVNAQTITTAKALFSSDDDMGEIAGSTVGREEFDNLLDYNTQLYKLPYMIFGGQEPKMTEAMTDELNNKTWQDLIFKYMMDKEYAKVGMTISDAELTDITIGANMSHVISQSVLFYIFGGQETGEIDRAQLANFVQNMDGAYKTYWISLEKDVIQQQLYMRYAQLDMKSNYVNSLEVANALEGEKDEVEFSYFVKDYSSVSDSLISFNSSDIKNYYEKHKESFYARRSRDIEFVAFTVAPSSNDYEKVMFKMEELQNKMDTLSAADMSLFVRMNSDVPFDNVFRKQGELPEVLDTVVFSKKAGDVLPYYQEGDSYKLSGIVEFRNMPDSVRAQHILFSKENEEKVDSVFDAIKGGASFGEMAAEYSIDGSRFTEGDLGWFSFETMVRPFADSCFLNPVGSVMKVTTQFGIHIIKVTNAKDFSNKVLLATVQKNILPSRETYQSYFAMANKIATKSEGNIDKFRAACVEEGVFPTVETNIMLENKSIGRFQNAGNLMHWIYRAKEGDISGVIEIENRNTCVVAVLTSIKNEGIPPLKKIKNIIANDVIQEKKADYLVSLMQEAAKGANGIDEVAKKMEKDVRMVSPAVNFNSSYIPALGLENKLIGAVYATPENKLSAPVAGNQGVYMYTVTSKQENPQAQTPEAIKSRLEMEATYSNFYTTLLSKAKIVDNRGKFY